MAEVTNNDETTAVVSTEYEGSGATNVVTVRRLKTTLDAMMAKIYPVGSIYMSMNDTNPGTLFGGTWEQIEGRFLLGMGFTGSENSSSHFGATTGIESWQPEKAGETGGEAWHSITVDEMPSHAHTPNGFALIYDSEHRGNSAGAVGDAMAGYGYLRTKGFPVTTGGYTGGNHAMTAMPPYFAVYMWRRTA